MTFPKNIGGLIRYLKISRKGRTIIVNGSNTRAGSSVAIIVFGSANVDISVGCRGSAEVR